MRAIGRRHYGNIKFAISAFVSGQYIHQVTPIFTDFYCRKIHL